MIARPFQQSDLDGLCGMHSVINAVRYLFPARVTEANGRAEALAHALADSMPGAAFVEAWKNGVELPQIASWLTRANAWLAPDGSHAFDTWCPTDVRSARSAERFWRLLGQDVQSPQHDRCCAIVGFGEPWPHWTVIIGMTERSVFHLDSSGERRTRKDITFVGKRPPPGGWLVEPGSTIILRRPA